MAQKKLTNVEPAYAGVKVAEIDARLEALDAEKVSLNERRKLYAPHVPKKSTAKND